MISILSTAFFSIAPFAQQSNGAERNLIEGQGSIIRIGDWGLPEVDYENASRLSLSEPPARLTFPILIAEHKGSEDSGRSNAPLVHLETFRKRSFIGNKAQEAFFPLLRKNDRTTSYFANGSYAHNANRSTKTEKDIASDSAYGHENMSLSNTIAVSKNNESFHVMRQVDYSCEDVISYLSDDSNDFDLWTFGAELFEGNSVHFADIQTDDRQDAGLLRNFLANGLIEEAVYFEQHLTSDLTSRNELVAMMEALSANFSKEGAEGCDSLHVSLSDFTAQAYISDLDKDSAIELLSLYNRVSPGLKLYFDRDRLLKSNPTMDDYNVSSFDHHPELESIDMHRNLPGEQKVVNPNNLASDALAALSIEGRASESEGILWKHAFDDYLQNNRYFDALRHLELQNTLDQATYLKSLKSLLTATINGADILTAIEILESVPDDIGPLHFEIAELRERLIKEGFEGNVVLEISDEAGIKGNEDVFLNHSFGQEVSSHRREAAINPGPEHGGAAESSIISLADNDESPVSVRSARDAMHSSSSIRAQILERLPDQ